MIFLSLVRCGQLQAKDVPASSMIEFAIGVVIGLLLGAVLMAIWFLMMTAKYNAQDMALSIQVLEDRIRKGCRCL